MKPAAAKPGRKPSHSRLVAVAPADAAVHHASAGVFRSRPFAYGVGSSGALHSSPRSHASPLPAQKYSLSADGLDGVPNLTESSER